LRRSVEERQLCARDVDIEATQQLTRAGALRGGLALRLRARDGPKDPHHQRSLHAGLLRVRGLAPDGLVFELGVRPGAPSLARYRSGDVVAA
jgi:hypothetical protein